MSSAASVVALVRRNGWALAAVLVAAVCAGRAYGLIEATSLWKDELSTAHKVYQPSLAFLLNYLRGDSHPPFYYLSLWWLGQELPQTAWLLRVFSWIAYGLAGGLMTLQAWLLARASGLERPGSALAVAAVLAFASPFPVRFSIEAKGYALLVALLALALLCRQILLLAARSPGVPLLLVYGVALCLAALTHYYGFFYLVALIAVDGVLAGRRSAFARPRRMPLLGAELLAALPVLAWILGMANPAGMQRSVAWIGTPSLALLEDVLARFLGPWPWLKLLAGLLVIGLLLRAGWVVHRAPLRPIAGGEGPVPWLDASGLLAGLVMAGLVVAISFVRPVAFARYFIVLVPGLVVWSSCRLACLQPVQGRGRFALAAITVLVVALFWRESFLPLQPGGVAMGSRESSNFREVALAAADYDLRYTITPIHLAAYDRLLVQAGQLTVPPAPWREIRSLAEASHELPATPFLIAATGSERSLRREFEPVLEQLATRGISCREIPSDRAFVRLLHCRPD